MSRWLIAWAGRRVCRGTHTAGSFELPRDCRMCSRTCCNTHSSNRRKMDGNNRRNTRRHDRRKTYSNNPRNTSGQCRRHVDRIRSRSMRTRAARRSPMFLGLSRSPSGKDAPDSSGSTAIGCSGCADELKNAHAGKLRLLIQIDTSRTPSRQTAGYFSFAIGE